MTKKTKRPVYALLGVFVVLAGLHARSGEVTTTAAALDALEDPVETLDYAYGQQQEMLREVTAHLPNVRIEFFKGLLVDFARDQGASAIVKGLRAVSDFDYELQMAQMNQRLSGIDTFFISTSPQYSFLSSSLVREVGRFGGDVSTMVGVAGADWVGRRAALFGCAAEFRSRPLPAPGGTVPRDRLRDGCARGVARGVVGVAPLGAARRAAG